jgi:two-component system NarL family response regulator
VPSRLNLIVARELQHDWQLLEQSFSTCPDIVLMRASSGMDGIIEECHAFAPGIVLVDDKAFAAVPKQLEFIRRARATSLSIVVRVDVDEPENERKLLRVGCKGIVRVDLPAEELCRAIQTVSYGGLWARLTSLSKVIEEFLDAEALFHLSRRETEILDLVGRGETNQRIAEALCISRETVRWHLRTLYAKLGVRDREAIALHLPGLTSKRRIPNRSVASTVPPLRRSGS